MKAFAYWTIIFIVGFTSGLWVQSQTGAIQRDLFNESIGLALGNAIGVILAPLLLIVLPQKIYSLFKKQEYVPNRVLTTLVAGIVLLAFVSNAHRDNSEFAFSPEGCNFKVNFPSEPEPYDYVLHEGTTHEIKGKGAQYFSRDGVSVLKAECIAAPNVFNTNNFRAAEHQEVMDMIAESMQLNNVEFSQSLLPDFIVLNIDGYKTFDDKEVKIRVSNYIADDTNFTTYRISSLENFDLSELTSFEESVSYSPLPLQGKIKGASVRHD